MSQFNEMKVLAALGIEISLDFDDELLISFPEKLELRPLRELLLDHSEDLCKTLRWERMRAMRTFVGGPKNGESYLFWEPTGKFRGFNYGRAKWAVYEFSRDGRAFFRGWATSEMKACNGKFVREES